MLREQSKSSKDVLLADSFKTCGLGYRLIMPNDNEDELSLFKITTLNPMCAFVVYKNDAFREPMLGVSFAIPITEPTKLAHGARKTILRLPVLLACVHHAMKDLLSSRGYMEKFQSLSMPTRETSLVIVSDVLRP